MKKTDNLEQQAWKLEFTFRLTHRMRYLNLDVNELSKRSGIAASSIRSYLDKTSDRIPNAFTVSKLAKALITDSSFLIDFVFPAQHKQ